MKMADDKITTFVLRTVEITVLNGILRYNVLSECAASGCIYV